MDADALRSLSIVFIVAAATPILADVFRRLRVPTVVLDLAIGVIVGPELLGWVQTHDIVSFFSTLGMAMLFFLIGFELDLPKLRGKPLKLGALTWFGSLVVAMGCGFVLFESGVVWSDLVTGLALATTALGVVMPVLRDAKQLDTGFGRYVMGVGVAGEVLPILAIALLLSGDAPLKSTAVLVAFVVAMVGAIGVALAPHPPRMKNVFSDSLHSSGQFGVRLCIAILLCLVWLASSLGVDVLLGALAAGLVVRIFFRDASNEEEFEVLSSKLEAVGYGFLVPVFFVVSGAMLDISSLGSLGAILRVPLFFLLFLVVRGVPVYFGYKNVLEKSERVSIALMAATSLPLVVAITSIGVSTGRMRSATAAALVCAAALSALIFPALAATVRKVGQPV